MQNPQLFWTEARSHISVLTFVCYLPHALGYESQGLVVVIYAVTKAGTKKKTKLETASKKSLTEFFLTRTVKWYRESKNNVLLIEKKPSNHEGGIILYFHSCARVPWVCSKRTAVIV